MQYLTKLPFNQKPLSKEGRKTLDRICRKSKTRRNDNWVKVGNKWVLKMNSKFQMSNSK